MSSCAGVGGPSGDGPLYLGVIGLGGTGITGDAWSGPIDQPDGAMVELHLDPPLVPEVWARWPRPGSVTGSPTPRPCASRAAMPRTVMD